MKRLVSLICCIALLTVSVIGFAAEESWTCPSCKTENTQFYCTNCGLRRPEVNWTCSSCGNENSGNFCGYCGSAKPESETSEKETAEYPGGLVDALAGIQKETDPVSAYNIVIDDAAGIIKDSELESVLEEMRPIGRICNIAFVSFPVEGKCDYTTMEKCRLWGDAVFGKTNAYAVFMIDMKNRYLNIYASAAISDILTSSVLSAIADKVYLHATNSEYATCAMETFRLLYSKLNSGNNQEPEPDRDTILSVSDDVYDPILIRKEIIQDLSASSDISKGRIDPETGDIVLESSAFFETGDSHIRGEGQDLLNCFIPEYMNVMLQEKYAEYLNEIIIESHTDSSGSYESNLKLTQDQALSIVLYCLDLPSLTRVQKQKLQGKLSAKGCSYSDLIYDANGKEKGDASCRVIFKFTLNNVDEFTETKKKSNEKTEDMEEMKGESAEIDNIVLFYNPDGGEYYHIDQNCTNVHRKLLPLKDQFTYAELNEEPYKHLKPCNICGAPLRP